MVMYQVPEPIVNKPSIGRRDISYTTYHMNPYRLICSTVKFPACCSLTWDQADYTIDGIVQSIEGKAPMHEAIFGPVVPYFDFELDYQGLEAVYEVKRRIHLRECRETLAAIYGPTARVFILDASGWHTEKKAWRVSFHFIVRGAGYYESGRALLASGRVPEGPGWDRGIYKCKGSRQNMRIFGSPKNDGTRPLVMITKDNTTRTMADLKQEGRLDMFMPFLIIQQTLTEPLMPDKEPEALEWVVDTSRPLDVAYPLEAIRELCDIAGARQLDWGVYDTWTRWGWMLANISTAMAIDLLPSFHEYAQQSPKYREADTTRIFAQRRQSGRQLNFGTLCHLAREKDAAKYKEWRQSHSHQQTN